MSKISAFSKTRLELRLDLKALTAGMTRPRRSGRIPLKSDALSDHDGDQGEMIAILPMSPALS